MNCCDIITVYVVAWIIMQYYIKHLHTFMVNDRPYHRC